MIKPYHLGGQKLGYKLFAFNSWLYYCFDRTKKEGTIIQLLTGAIRLFKQMR